MAKPVLRVIDNSNTFVAVSKFDPKEWIETLHCIVWNDFITGRRSLEDLAEMADLRFVTVESFAWRDTKRPAATTVYKLAVACGYQLPFIPMEAGHQADEVSLAMLQAQHPERKAS